jgi:hypothetical protein
MLHLEERNSDACGRILVRSAQGGIDDLSFGLIKARPISTMATELLSQRLHRSDEQCISKFQIICEAL